MIKSYAEELFKEKGVDSTSVNDIVKKAGIAKGTFYPEIGHGKEADFHEVVTCCLCNVYMILTFWLDVVQLSNSKGE